MQLPRAQLVFSDLAFHEELDSTNAELARNQGVATRHFSAVIAASQLMGRGRLGRSWQSPAGSSLALSVFLEEKSIAEPGWASLLAALAVQNSLLVMGVTGSGLKWPNDVLVSGKKISGILAQLLPDGAVIVGIGLNLKPQQSALANAVSLQELGIFCDLDTAAALIGENLKELLAAFALDSKSVKGQFSQSCITLGQQVRAELPDGGELIGLASEIAHGGQLVILTPEEIILSAADVWHLRS